MSAITRRLDVLAVGARAPFGQCSLQMATGFRAERYEPRSTRFTDKDGSLIGCARSRGVSEELHGIDRFVALAAPALREAVGGWRGDPLPCFLALPDPARPDQKDPKFQNELLAKVAAAAEVELDMRASRVVRADQAGFVHAYEVAGWTAGAKPDVPFLVGAIDSQYDPDVLRWMAEEGRIHSIDNEEGVVPSEGAAFALLGDAAACSKRAGRKIAPLAHVLHAELAREDTVLKDEPNVAAALTGLVRRAVAAAPGQRVPWTITDMTLEHGRVREWSLVSSRFVEELAATRVDHWSHRTGCLGAATAGVHFVMACRYWSIRCAPASVVLLTVSGEGAERAAVVLQSAEVSS